MTQYTKFQLFDFVVYTVWACLKGVTPYKTLKEEGLIEMSTTVLSIYAMHSLSHNFIILIFEQNILTIITTSIVTQSTTFQLFDLLVYTVWACLKAMTI